MTLTQISERESLIRGSLWPVTPPGTSSYIVSPDLRVGTATRFAMNLTCRAMRMSASSIGKDGSSLLAGERSFQKSSIQASTTAENPWTPCFGMSRSD